MFRMARPAGRTRANVFAALLAIVLGFALATQVQQTSSEGLENLREDELVRIFAGVDQDGDRLADEIRGLEVPATGCCRRQSTTGRGANGGPGAAGRARHPRGHRSGRPAPASS